MSLFMLLPARPLQDAHPIPAVSPCAQLLLVAAQKLETLKQLKGNTASRAAKPLRAQDSGSQEAPAALVLDTPSQQALP